MIFTFLVALIVSISQVSNANPLVISELKIYPNDSLPKDAVALLIDGNSALAFAPPNSIDGGTVVLAGYPGDYYSLRAETPGKQIQIDDSIPHILINGTYIIRAEASQIEGISRNGWGLTRLNPEVAKISEPAKITPSTITDVDPNIADMVSVITQQTSKQTLDELCAFATRYSFAQQCRDAEQYVFDSFSALGLTASFYTYDYLQTTMRDAIGQLTGTAHPDSIIIICAHLDCTSESPNTLAPGAEDNATGVAVVLEAARAFSIYQTEYTVRFIAFTGEEQGLIGSDRYATAIQRQGEKIKAVINVDMVGYSGPYAEDMHIFCDPVSYGLGALGASIVANYSDLDTITHYEQAPRNGSDHYSFAIRNYPAIFFIDAWDDFDWYPYYHTVSDTVGNLNLDQQVKIAQSITALAATLANPDFGPGYLPGDANGSGSVNGIDVVYMVNYLKGGPSPNPLLSGDSNGDCNANGLDVVYLVNYLKGGPAPFLGNCR